MKWPFSEQQTGHPIQFHSLKRCLMLLDDNPMMRHSAEDIQTGSRRFTHQHHVVFYREREPGIFIIRVLHKAMDVDKQFDGEIEEPLLVYG